MIGASANVSIWTSIEKAKTQIAIGKKGDLLLRERDCAVIEFEHTINETARVKSFDSVRGAFIEGKKLYPNSGIYEKNHIQICVRNPNCIKGYFLPRTKDDRYSNPE